jgi:hypothetical protein
MLSTSFPAESTVEQPRITQIRAGSGRNHGTAQRYFFVGDSAHKTEREETLRDFVLRGIT